MRHRVVVTGLGSISSGGSCVPELWTNVLQGKSCIRKLPFVSKCESIPCKVGATINEDTYNECLKGCVSTQRLRTLSRSTCLALIAAKEAITNSKLTECDPNIRQNIGVAIGSGMSDFIDICDTNLMLPSNYNKISPYFIPRILLNMAAGNISMDYGFQGPNHTVSTACATGAHAIGDSYKMIRDGEAVAMVCGGTDACVNPLTVAGFCRLRALSTKFNDTPEKASRPFDQQRDGFVMGEGAAVLVLEKMEHALQRNAIIYAEILGYGMSGDALNLTSPHPDGRGAILSMNRAINKASLKNLTEISYINAHATSTPVGDNIELNAISNLLTHNNDQTVYVSSTKGCHGHLLGAAGSIELVCTVLACYNAIIPPTTNLENCIDHKTNIRCNKEPVKWEGVTKRIALKNSFGFGGTNATLCISEFQR
ncbi:hypothetical protein V9T40_010205 [Parthenolecanium corni]|uniref:3-oxoacyl-[acyl-carrier-protein] synthase n=1 Tax=Parthenolecanium corni TaxID=536013 RepID=A0AAN9T8D7_9HEMI